MIQKMMTAVIVLVSVQTMASERLLRCNPPMGSSLQEVEIVLDNGKILLNELNMSGSRSMPIEVPAASWAKKDLQWTSKDEGKIHLYQVTEGQAKYWAYQSEDYGSQVIGYCQ